MRQSFGRLLAAVAGALMAAMSAQANADPLRIGYSDWPGWVLWEVAIQKGWFKEAGVDVKFDWFDYSASMDAFSAGKLDANSMTNGDTLVTGATGGKGVMILVNDYSNGNDMIVAKPGFDSIKSLKGQKVGVEVGLVDHLLLLQAFKDNGMKDTDVQLVNTPTNELPQVLASGDVAAIGAWQPSSGVALKLVPGSKAIYTSAQAPGLIYDVLAVSPQSLAMHRDEWKKVVQVWYKTVAYYYDPKTHDDAIRIMASRVGVTPKEYATFANGTKILKPEQARKAFEKGDGLSSLYGSSQIADDFNVNNKVYKQAQDVNSYIDPSLKP